VAANDIKRLAKEAKSLIREIEEGRPERAAWIAVQEKLLAMSAAGSSQRDIAELVGKSSSWVQRVLRWDPRGGGSPHAEPGKPSKAGPAHAREVLRGSPESVAPEIARALEDPKVAQAVAKSSRAPARRNVMRAVETESARDVIANAPPSRSNRSVADINAATSERRGAGPPPDTWKPFRAGIRYSEAAVESFRDCFEAMHSDSWNLPPQIIEGIERDATKLAAELGEQVTFLQGLADTAGQYVNR
jgi:hypothetical protein